VQRGQRRLRKEAGSHERRKGSKVLLDAGMDVVPVSIAALYFGYYCGMSDALRQIAP